MSSNTDNPRGALATLLAREDYQGVLRELESISSKRPLHPHECVLRGRCIQLSNKDGEPLASAEEAFLAALELDEEYVPALLELGWFHHAVLDDSSTAEAWFAKAHSLCEQWLTEASSGRQECSHEEQEK